MRHLFKVLKKEPVLHYVLLSEYKVLLLLVPFSCVQIRPEDDPLVTVSEGGARSPF